MNAPIKLQLLLDAQRLERNPFPIPTGWFFAAYSDSLAKGEVKNINFLNQEWVMFRGENGTVGITDPYCPHLGAHLGHGSKVVGDNLQCTFHHWEYNAEGFCKHIPYAKVMPPITKKQPILRTLPVVERYGLIWAWYHPEAVDPQWELPAIPEMEEPGHVKPRRWSGEVNTAIQEVAENGVDNVHLKYLHGAPIVPPTTATFEDHKMQINIGMGYIIGDMYGPGLNVMRFTKDGVTATMISYSVPITRDKTGMNMSFTYKDYPQGTKERAIAEHLVAHSIGEAEGESSAGFESVDMIVWNNKKYRAKPLLCDGDGQIIKYRQWFKQFYPGMENSDKI
ncbi:MAG TPA: Rieske 2Fe-2S domain-containing protein [Nevskia sp.]|nr:Rieske 2Fe-2S domain-containing protein [Nevskia sp.]